MPLSYDPNLKHLARQLRNNMTDSEKMLWACLRGRQLMDVQFYRQKPIGECTVDFYAPKMKLVVEVDGSQHRNESDAARDRVRDEFMSRLGLKGLRFNSREVLREAESVLETIYRTRQDRLSEEIPLDPPLPKGEAGNGASLFERGETETYVPPLKKGARRIWRGW
jgi:very-short-patch-repair endonuclease